MVAPNQQLDKASRGDRRGHHRDGDVETTGSKSLCGGGGLLTAALVFSQCCLLATKTAAVEASGDSFFAAKASFLFVAAPSSVSSCRGWQLPSQRTAGRDATEGPREREDRRGEGRMEGKGSDGCGKERELGI